MTLGEGTEATLVVDIAFWVIAVSSIVSAIAVIQLKSLFRSALFLIVSFVGTAGMFVLLRAEFLAVVQVLIYVGAISILVIFAIMLTRDVQHGNMPNRLHPTAVVVCSVLLVVFISTFLRMEWDLLPAVLPMGLEQVLTNTPNWLAMLLLREYVLPFEAVSVLLLAAVIGALALVREK